MTISSGHFVVRWPACCRRATKPKQAVLPAQLSDKTALHPPCGCTDTETHACRFVCLLSFFFKCFCLNFVSFLLRIQSLSFTPGSCAVQPQYFFWWLLHWSLFRDSSVIVLDEGGKGISCTYLGRHSYPLVQIRGQTSLSAWM